MRLLYFSPVAAASYKQRPHYMVDAWLRRGAEQVLWVEPYPKRLPNLDDFRRARARATTATTRDPRVRVLPVPALPIEPLPSGASLNRVILWQKVGRELATFVQDHRTIVGIGCPSALALYALRSLPSALSFYDAMDDFPEFYRGLSRRALLRREVAIAREVDWIVTSSDYIQEKFSKRRPSVERVLNGYDMKSVTGLGARPAEPAVIGYIGCIGRWFDWPLVIRIASEFPESVVRLVGPLEAGLPKVLPRNVQLLPACDQGAASRHVRAFSVGLIPFRDEPLTRGVDPIKYYEYRAHGLPVVSTAFGQMRGRSAEPGVFLIKTVADAQRTIRAALKFAVAPINVARFRQEHDWQSRFEHARLFERAATKALVRVPAPKGLRFAAPNFGPRHKQAMTR